YALHYPGNLRKLILLNSMPASTELWNREEMMLAERMTRSDSLARVEIIQSEAFRKFQPKAIEELLLLSFRNQFFDGSKVDSLDFYIPDDYMERSRKFRNLMVDLAAYDLHDQLSVVKTPTLLIYGSMEPAVEISAPRLQKELPNSTLVIMDDTGHFPFVEKPDIFLQSVRAFLHQR
ncbi:MAG: alpha/beta hydrolase, partial [Balneolaceae bacterium]|nr:alpha/beta hydrolase [Balneolaceae bacterium]